MYKIFWFQWHCFRGVIFSRLFLPQLFRAKLSPVQRCIERVDQAVKIAVFPVKG